MQSSSARPASPFRAPREPGAIDILILDDERFDRHRLARLCSGLDFPCEVHNAKTLKEFETRLTDAEFGLILLDYCLPDGTGIDAMSLLRLNALNLNTPALMISGQDLDDLETQAQAAGCAGYLNKNGLSSDRFAKAVRGALSRRAKRKPSRSNRFTPQEVELFLSDTTARCAQEVKPLVSRLMRQLRSIRTAENGMGETTLRHVEEECLAVWNALLDMERTDGETLFLRVFDTKKEDRPEKSEGLALRPPSPFKSRRQ